MSVAPCHPERSEAQSKDEARSTYSAHVFFVMSACTGLPPDNVCPTAQSVVDDGAKVAAFNWSLPEFGLLTIAHAFPFQCSASVDDWELPTAVDPTAHTSFDEDAVLPKSPLFTFFTLGDFTMLHLEPFQCSVNVANCVPV